MIAMRNFYKRKKNVAEARWKRIVISGKDNRSSRPRTVRFGIWVRLGTKKNQTYNHSSATASGMPSWRRSHRLERCWIWQCWNNESQSTAMPRSRAIRHRPHPSLIDSLRVDYYRKRTVKTKSDNVRFRALSRDAHHVAFSLVCPASEQLIFCRRHRPSINSLSSNDRSSTTFHLLLEQYSHLPWKSILLQPQQYQKCVIHL